MMRWLAAAVLGWTLTVAGAAEFGRPERFAEGRVLKFPGLDVEFVGERVVTSSQYPRGFRMWDFVARRGEQKEKVAWSAGTGDIAPVTFRFGGTGYVLEMSYSEGLQRRLKSHELVLWEDAAFARARAER
jgi:hypothetical protein